jgi:spermidine synthase
MPRSGRALFSVLFFLSGLAGLVYEVCWTRLLRLPMGNTVYSLTTVLTAFMAGLALGSYLAGRWIDRRGRPLLVYALLEAAIGLFCFFLPWIVRAEEPLFRWAYQHLGTSFLAFHLMKFVACGLVILAPATLMGATLPVLCRQFVDDPAGLGRSLGWLYGVNAFGAVAGSLLAGFVLLPALGLVAAIRVGVVTSLGVAAISFAASRRLAAPSLGSAAPAASAAPPAAPPARRVLLLAGYGLSGLAAMVLQIAWARVLALVIGSSVYAFALLVAAFILGLALGSSVASRFADRLRHPARGFAVAELGIAFTTLAMLPVFARFPAWMVRIVPEVSQDFGRFQLVQFGLLFATLLLPTACMGACLPLVGKTLARGLEHAGETVGSAYSANAVGTILGAFLGGFAILPALGIQKTILTGAAINLGVGVAVLAVTVRRRRGLAAGVPALAGLAALVLAPGFDPVTLSSGAYYYAAGLRPLLEAGRTLADVVGEQYNILMHREGLSSTITVKESVGGDRTLAINGKVDASDHKDMVTQLLSGHLVALLHPEPRDAAIIGLATGVTTNSVAQHPSVRSIDCIEIDPEMTQACRLFDHVNGRILDDPRVRLVIQDGRNHLTLTDRQYDIILSEPSNPWVAGIASLYTLEFLEACRDRLRPGGLMCLWVHVYGFDLHAIRSMIRTFATVFPQATLWETYFLADYVLIGSRDRVEVRWDDLVRRLAEPRVRADLERVRILSPADLLVRHVAGPAGVGELAATGEVYRDDDNQLEFAAPRLMYHRVDPKELAVLQQVRQPGLPSWLAAPPGGLPAPDAAALAASQAAQRLFWEGVLHEMAGDAGAATQAFLAALERNPRLGNVGEHLVDTARGVADFHLAAGDTLAVDALYRKIIALGIEQADFYNDLGVLESQRGRLDAAVAAYRRALVLEPRNLQMRANLALALEFQGQTAAAEAELRRILDRRATYVPARLQLGNLRAASGDAGSAEREFRAAVSAAPRNGEAWYFLAESVREQRGCSAALAAYETALRFAPRYAPARQRLAACYRELGQPDAAARLASPVR